MTSFYIKRKTIGTILFLALVFAGGFGYGEYKKIIGQRQIDVARSQTAQVDKLLEGTAANSLVIEDASNQTKRTKAEFFVDYRLERDRTRSQQIELLREMVNNQNSSTEIRKDAQRRLLQITSSLEREMEIENLLRAKDFKDAVAFIQGDTITIVVQTKEFTQEDNHKIINLVTRSTGVSSDNIVIVPKE